MNFPLKERKSFSRHFAETEGNKNVISFVIKNPNKLRRKYFRKWKTVWLENEGWG